MIHHCLLKSVHLGRHKEEILPIETKDSARRQITEQLPPIVPFIPHGFLLSSSPNIVDGLENRRLKKKEHSSNNRSKMFRIANALHPL